MEFFWNQSDKTKSGILIGFFSCVFRICSPKYLNKEFRHIHRFFFQTTISRIFHSPGQIKSHKYSHTNPIKRHIIFPKNPTTALTEKKNKLESLRYKNDNLLNKNNKTNSKEKLPKRWFPIQRRCLQNLLLKLQ